MMPKIPYWIDQNDVIHETTGSLSAGYQAVTLIERVNSPDPSIRIVTLENVKMVVNHLGEFHYNRLGFHRLDGPAITYRGGRVQYWVNGKRPVSMMDLLIIDDEIDYDSFLSARLIQDVVGVDNFRIYLISDPDELTLAILRYS